MIVSWELFAARSARRSEPYLALRREVGDDEYRSMAAEAYTSPRSLFQVHARRKALRTERLQR